MRDLGIVFNNLASESKKRTLYTVIVGLLGVVITALGFNPNIITELLNIKQVEEASKICFSR